ncbi:hypothetical protein KPH14_008173 [Odynerus spinipes]|uniref:Uncharacterized protein n=1 Tax=Odynerus spinipes TaxID=1348599 RepID=A0AAD9RDQ9_9HYME|nr:hypothetical protein KPH14_008173 [Odynerus spinipes]
MKKVEELVVHNKEEEVRETRAEENQPVQEMPEAQAEEPNQEAPMPRRMAGRKLGQTNEDVQTAHRIKLMEREEKLQSEGARRSKRLLDKCMQANAVIEEIITTPTDYEEAVESEQGESWLSAMNKEMNSSQQHNVWELVPGREGMKVIKSTDGEIIDEVMTKLKTEFKMTQTNEEIKFLNIKLEKDGTKELELVYSRNRVDLQISTNASWGTTRIAKSYSGYTVKIGECLIAWKSQKQKLVTLSTCESEIVVICEGAKELKLIFAILNSLGMNEACKVPIVLKTDTQSAIDWIYKNNVTNRTKHIDRKYYFVRDEVKKGNIKLQHISTDNMEADILTKGLTYDKHSKCGKKLGLQ